MRGKDGDYFRAARFLEIGRLNRVSGEQTGITGIHNRYIRIVLQSVFCKTEGGVDC